MKKIISALIAGAISLSAFTLPSFAENKNIIKVHGENEGVIENAISLEGSTMVPIRTLSEILGMEIIWLANLQTVVLWNDEIEFRAVINNSEALINNEAINLSHVPVIVDGYTYLPLRNVAEATDAQVVWNPETGDIDVFIKKKEKAEPQEIKAAENNEEKAQTVYDEEIKGKPFFSQRQSEWGLENKGSGYCWVCCYAMAISSATGEFVTPEMVKKVNLQKGSGAYVQHHDIITEFDVSFTPAIDEESEYFVKYDSWRGSTYINAETDEEAVEAIKQALIKNPQGVMVRYTVYPHTLFAVGYDEENIYFHEPAYIDSDAVTFEETCLKKYKISDLDFLQAIKD